MVSTQCTGLFRRTSMSSARFDGDQVMQTFGPHGEDSPARRAMRRAVAAANVVGLNMVLPYFWVASAKEIVRCGP